MKQLEVFLDGQHCGTISQTSTGNSLFGYAEDYRTRAGATPLSLSMPLAAQSHPKKVVLPFFQGLLPDNLLALEAIAGRFGVSPRNPFALLEHVGSDVAGAVQVLPPGEAPTDRYDATDEDHPVEPADVAAMLQSVIDDYQTGTSARETFGRFSLAGAQPKIALRLSAGQWSVPIAGAATTHILKPVTGALPTIDVIEYITMRAATLLGLPVAHSELHTIGAMQALVLARYDREYDGARVRRLHQEDLCQALAVSPDKKYQHRDGGPGVGAIAGLFRSLPWPQDAQDAARHFFSALVFNTLAGCTDAHAKNYSLLLEGSRVRLAPLYDLASVAAYWDGQSRLNMAMSIGGNYALQQIALADLVSEGDRLGVESPDLIVQRIRAGLLDAFAVARDELVDIRADAKDAANRLLDNLPHLPLLNQR